VLQNLLRVFVQRGDEQTSGPSLDAVLDSADRHIHELDNLVLPAPTSKPRTRFDTNLPRQRVSMANFTAGQRLRAARRAVPLFRNMSAGAKLYRKRFPASSDRATPALLRDFETLARSMGARDIGYVEVPNYAIFQRKGIPCRFAIVFTVEMQQEPIETAPSFECQLEVMDGYKRMSRIAMRLTHYLRTAGYEAYPGTALGGVTDYVHLGELAGLGAIGYHGLLITPGEGARLRINTIYTNIANLPTLEATGRKNEHLWVRDFCAMCRKCIRSCPVQAIYETPRARGDGGMQSIDHGTCRDYFASNFGCGVCLAVCPFSHSGYSTVKERFKGNERAPQFRIPVLLEMQAESAPQSAPHTQ
jgi:ferredoxin